MSVVRTPGTARVPESSAPARVTTGVMMLVKRADPQLSAGPRIHSDPLATRNDPDPQFTENGSLPGRQGGHWMRRT